MRRSGTRIGLLLVALLLVLAGVVGAFALAGGGPQRPRTVASPSVAAFPSRSPLLAADPGGPLPSRAGLLAELAKPLADTALGPDVALSIEDASTGAPLLDVAGASPVPPASTAKLFTAAAALEVLGPDKRLRTTVLAGPTAGSVVLVGGGDATLTDGSVIGGNYPHPARVRDLAVAVRAALGPAALVRQVIVDDSLYSGPTTGPGWRPDYVSTGNVAPVDALSVDGGRVRSDRVARVADPGLAAGAALSRDLQPDRPVTVSRGRALAGAATLATVDSPPVADLVEQMLMVSDNDIAESLARQVALSTGGPGTFAGGADAVVTAVRALLGGDVAGTRMVDGSGLSRLDRIPPTTLVRLLAGAAGGGHPELSAELTGLPVAGFTGTLADRFRQGPAVPAAGEVRAKTGTLEGVSTLAGLVRTRDGRLLAFSVAADKVPTGGVSLAEGALDRVAAVLAACGCH